MVLKNKILIGALCGMGVICVAAISLYRGSHISVSLHGVNYSEQEFSYFIADPDAPDKSIGGEHIGPFAAGGTTCCAVLPREWKPGTKVRLRTTHWLKQLSDGSLPEVKAKHEVDVPKYAEVGELWVIRDRDGRISVVSSNVEPGHPAWPGKLKGWPVPSLEYQRERWEIYRNIEQGYVDAFESLLRELDEDPAKRAKEAWVHDKDYSTAELKRFTGPDDPLYRKYLRERYVSGLQRSKNDLAEIMKAKP